MLLRWRWNRRKVRRRKEEVERKGGNLDEACWDYLLRNRLDLMRLGRLLLLKLRLRREWLEGCRLGNRIMLIRMRRRRRRRKTRVLTILANVYRFRVVWWLLLWWW